MEKLQLTDFVSYRSLSSVELSPNGKIAAFIVKQADLEQNDYASNIFLCQLDTGDVSQLTDSRRVVAFDWLGDSQHILFIEWEPYSPESEPRTLIHVIGIDGATARNAEGVAGWATSIRLLDDQRLLYTARVDVTTGAIAGNGQPDCEVVDELPFWRDSQGFTNKKRVHLHLFDIDKQESEELTESFLDVEAFDIRGEQIVLAGTYFEHVAPLRSDIYLLHVGDHKLQKLTTGTHRFETPRFVTDEVVMVLASDITCFGFRQNKEVYALHLTDGRLQNLTSGWDRSVRQHSVWSDVRLGAATIARADASRYYCITTELYSAYLDAVSLDGEVSRLVGEPGTVDDFDVRDGTIAYIAMRGTGLQELYTLQDGMEKQLTTLNVDALADKTVSPPEHFRVRTKEGTELDAWLIKPAAFETGKQYPGVLEIHGGPKMAASAVFYHEFQMLANEGYVVFYCNPRGSDGRGDVFHGDIRGRFGTLDYDDIMAVVEHVVRSYDFIDPTRLGVTGASYGGYMTNWIIGHTDLFKAAVSSVGISDLVSMTGTTEIGYYWLEDYMTVTLWDDIEKYWFHSPLRYAVQVKTPTLFLHSDQCYQCGLPQSLEMFTALKYFGVETRLCIFKGESHEMMASGKPKNRVHYWREMVEWFDKYLKGDDEE